MKPHSLLSLLHDDVRRASVLAALCSLSALSVSAQSKPADPSASVPPATASQPDQKTKAAASSDSDDSVIRLTPFEVNATTDHGYFSPNTLAGTRLNNNIADIPSSVTVVTQQQLLDTSSWDINDVFRYEANTEGDSTYTPIAMVRGSVGDLLATQAQTSGNRVRGLSTADLEVDNYFSLSRIPFDSYNTRSIEVDRGPNSILFGTGSPAGIVNQSRSQAMIDKTSGSVSLVGGSWGTYRQSSNFNIPVIKHKLSIYLAQAYTNQGFKQKPSSDIARREYAAFTFVPFRSNKTKITGSFEYYNHDAKDPNGITPIDLVTPWIQSGRPVYNPINDMVTYLATGKTSGPYALSKTSPNYAGILQTDMGSTTSPNFVPSLNYAPGGHNVMFMNQGNVENFYRTQQTGFSVSGWVPATMTPAQQLVNEEKVTWSVPLPTPTGYQVWQLPSVTNKSIYDWSTVNLSSMSYTHTDAKTYYLDFQQELIPNLNLDVGWFRQELRQFSDSPLSQANATTLYVDTNSFLLNGQANPHIGQPFVDGYASDVFESPEINNNFRASLEYELNLENKVPNWLKWMGHHRLMAVMSQHDDVQSNLRYRESIIGGDPNYLPTTATFTQKTGYAFPVSNTAIEQWYYLGGFSAGPTGQGTGSPGLSSIPPITGPITRSIQTYNYATGTWGTSNLSLQSVLFPTGGRSENVQDTKTYFWQPFLWGDRIVGTLGINDDFVKSRQTIFPKTNPNSVMYTNGLPNYSYWQAMGAWSRDSGRTTTTGFVVHPFKHWGRIDRAANNGSLIAGLARTISLTFNRSSNFNPPPAYYTDFFGNPLPKPQGTERDYGFEIATPDNKFFLRATWFRTANQNQFVSNTSNARATYIDATELKNWATAVVEVRNGINPSDPNFLNSSVYPITQQMQDQISALTGLPYTFGGNVGEKGQFVNPYETENGIARGIELELTYNPTPNWRMKFAWAQQKTILSNIAGQAAAWVAYRYPKWQTYAATDLTGVYTRSSGRAMYLGNFWAGYGYDSNIYQNQPYGWNTTKDYYDIVVNAQLATDRALNNTQATNQREFSWSYLSTYDFTRGVLKYFTVGGAFRYDGRAVAGYYGDTANLNPSGNVFQPDVNKPIYTPRQIHVDAWIGYNFKLGWAGDHIRGRVQFNVADLTQNGRLLPVSYNFDGSPAAERIILPRKFTLSTTFMF